MRTPTRTDREKETSELREPIELPGREAERLPMVAIVGRPNVGKSALFNRLTGRRRALVHDKPGMTRDRRIDRFEWVGREYLCVDTGGFDVELDDPLLENVAEQARIAIERADAVIFLTEVGEESHPAERELMEILRRSRKPMVVGVNKCDNKNLDLEANAFYAHGFEAVYPISALHGRGVDDLLDELAEKIDALDSPGEPYITGGIRLAVVGRQNVGKSSLINQLLGEERLIASPLPGTTRDAIDATIQSPAGDVFTLIDTAGIRRRGKVQRGIEKLSVLSSMMAIRRADVAALVVDGAEGLTAQDAHIAGTCVDEGLACILVVNKWDLVEKDHRTADQFTKSTERDWPFLRYAPVLYTSAKSGQRVARMLELAKRVYLNARRRIPTARLNELLAEWIRRKRPPLRRGREAKIRYITQTGVHPPSFTLFVNDSELFHFSYERYLINRLRDSEDFEGTPIRLKFRAGKRETPRA